MPNFKKLHKIEKDVADDIIELAHDNVRVETDFIRDHKAAIREFNVVYVPDFVEVPENRKHAKELTERLSAEWSALINRVKARLSMFLRNVGTTAAQGVLGALKPLTNPPDAVMEAFDIEGAWYADEEAINAIFTRKWIGKKNWQQSLDDIPVQSKLQFRKIFREGLTEGLGYREITRRIKKVVGVQATRVERIVRTEGQRISNDIIVKSYHRNRRWISGIQYTATLDARTCRVCGSYDRNEYYWEKLPSAYSAPYIPVHCMCRCVYVPISRIWEDLGRNWEVTRASQFGPVTGDYSSWLRRREMAKGGFAKGILGKNYDPWLKGEYSLKGKKIVPAVRVGDYIKTEKKAAQKAAKRSTKEAKG